MSKAFVVDIDGTLANIDHRLHLIDRAREGGPDWDEFFEACEDDQPIYDVVHVIQRLVLSHWTDRNHANVVYLTGRPERVRENTRRWLAEHQLPIGALLMRKDGDHRPDTITKREHMQRILDVDTQVVGVFEDRPSVCKVWREMGLTVFQVGSGEDF